MRTTDRAQDAALELIERYGPQGDDVKMDEAEAVLAAAGARRPHCSRPSREPDGSVPAAKRLS